LNEYREKPFYIIVVVLTPVPCDRKWSEFAAPARPKSKSKEMKKLKELVKDVEKAEAKCDGDKQSFTEFCAACDVVIEKKLAVNQRIHELTWIDPLRIKKLGYKNLMIAIDMMEGYAKRIMDEHRAAVKA